MQRVLTNGRVWPRLVYDSLVLLIAGVLFCFTIVVESPHGVVGTICIRLSMLFLFAICLYIINSYSIRVTTDETRIECLFLLRKISFHKKEIVWAKQFQPFYAIYGNLMPIYIIVRIKRMFLFSIIIIRINKKQYARAKEVFFK